MIHNIPVKIAYEGFLLPLEQGWNEVVASVYHVALNSFTLLQTLVFLPATLYTLKRHSLLNRQSVGSLLMSNNSHHLHEAIQVLEGGNQLNSSSLPLLFKAGSSVDFARAIVRLSGEKKLIADPLEWSDLLLKAEKNAMEVAFGILHYKQLPEGAYQKELISEWLLRAGPCAGLFPQALTEVGIKNVAGLEELLLEANGSAIPVAVAIKTLNQTRRNLGKLCAKNLLEGKEYSRLMAEIISLCSEALIVNQQCYAARFASKLLEKNKNLVDLKKAFSLLKKEKSLDLEHIYLVFEAKEPVQAANTIIELRLALPDKIYRLRLAGWKDLILKACLNAPDIHEAFSYTAALAAYEKRSTLTPEKVELLFKAQNCAPLVAIGMGVFRDWSLKEWEEKIDQAQGDPVALSRMMDSGDMKIFLESKENVGVLAKEICRLEYNMCLNKKNREPLVEALVQAKQNVKQVADAILEWKTSCPFSDRELLGCVALLLTVQENIPYLSKAIAILKRGSNSHNSFQDSTLAFSNEEIFQLFDLFREVGREAPFLADSLVLLKAHRIYDPVARQLIQAGRDAPRVAKAILELKENDFSQEEILKWVHLLLWAKKYAVPFSELISTFEDLKRGTKDFIEKWTQFCCSITRRNQPIGK